MTRDEQWLLHEKYSGVPNNAFWADCARLAAGEPLGYVIGHVPFLGCTIWLDSRPLIPRPETEWWTEQANKAIEHTMVCSQGNRAPLRILDLCAGSGAIGVAVAKHNPNTHVDFVEVDHTHHPTIQANLTHNLTGANVCIMDDTYKLYGGDLFAEIPQAAQYDFILSNPPYIDPALDRTEPTVKDYEPHQALYGGQSGMEIISRIIREAPWYLSANGQLWLEHEPEQSSMIHTLAAEHSFSATTQTDQYGYERYSILVLQ